MSRVKKLIVALSLPSTVATVFAGEEHGLSKSAEGLFQIGPLHVTNSILTSWTVSIALIIAIRLFVGRPKLVPSRGQAIVENLLDGVRNLTAPVVGAKVARYTFPLLIGLFTYILIQNWSSLFPGVGTVMFREQSNGAWTPFVRAGNADLNSTIALALVGITAWLYFILRYAGPSVILKDIFGNKATKGEVHPAMYYSLFVVFFIIGFIELISMMIRPVSLSLRLYGNAFGGEYVIHTMSEITRWGLPIPFYFLEFLVGLIQALVFTLLISVYIGLICNHQGGDHKDDHHDDKEASH
ncbi:MAG TPA: F0F1 ATP synthase subunit A [Rariglobus sp.]|jgi:F-type H+-transporting ATPase subunit a|nr:F0F1 ATP synthase subunit A [Rariglobus sp.]